MPDEPSRHITPTRDCLPRGWSSAAVNKMSHDIVQEGQELVFTYHNMLKSEAAIMQAIQELGPFDGICGFSQVRTCSKGEVRGRGLHTYVCDTKYCLLIGVRKLW